jgi:hypothetical protein
MKAIRTQNSKKHFAITISMLLFLFVFTAVSSAQQSSGSKISPTSGTYSLLFDYTENQLSELKAIEFEQSTIVSYSFPRYEEVTFIVFDKYGKEIKTLVEGEQNPGSYNIDLGSLNLASGVYYYQLSIGDDKDLKKIVINN